VCRDANDTSAGTYFHGSLKAHNSNTDVLFEVLTAVVIKNCIFWAIMLYSPLRCAGYVARVGEKKTRIAYW
jgi:hypothetical protein